jgi:hypothetical protein
MHPRVRGRLAPALGSGGRPGGLTNYGGRLGVWVITDAVRDGYVARWGPPSRNARLEVAGLEMEVLKWDATATSEGVTLYATIGASARPMAGREPGPRVEFFVGLLPAQDGIVSPLAALALYPASEGVAVGHDHTVPSDGPLWPETDMRRFLVLRPLGNIIPSLQTPDGVHVEFLQAIPIYESESAYRNKHTTEALLDQWEQSRVPFWDPNRPPAL